MRNGIGTAFVTWPWRDSHLAFTHPHACAFNLLDFRWAIIGVLIIMLSFEFHPEDASPEQLRNIAGIGKLREYRAGS